MEVGHYIKIPAGIQFTANGFGGNILGIIEDGDLRILDLIGQGKPENDDLHNGHSQEDEQRTPVAPDMVELFLTNDRNCFISV